MNKTKRRVFFIVSVILFFAVAGVIIAYSRGYQWQWSQKSFVRTGGIFIRTNQEALQVLVNGLSHDTQRRIIADTGTLINRLIPQAYEVQIEKEGYARWYKQLGIEPGIITEAKFVLLFQNRLNAEQLDSISGEKLHRLDETRITYFVTRPDNTRALKVRSLDRNENVIFPLSQNFSNPSFSVTLLAVSPSGNTVLLAREAPSPHYGLINTQSGILREFAQNGAIHAYQFDAEENLYYMTQNELFMVSSQTEEPTSPNALPARLQAFGIIQNNRVFIEATTSPTLKQVSQTSASPTTIATQPLTLPRADAPYQISRITNGLFLFHALNGPLIFFDSARNETSIIDNNVTRFITDPKNQKIAYVTASQNVYELKVFYVAARTEQPTKEARTIEIITKTTEPIGKFAWLTVDGFSEHILFEVGSRLTAIELDGRDRRNSALLHGETKSFLLNGLTVLLADANNQIFQAHLAF